jgi:MFS superfamily sulfate permease-like transporter
MGHAPSAFRFAGRGRFGTLKHDVPAGIVVFLVALPLCLGIALASGAPLLAGIVSGIVGGLVVARLSGAPLSVSGPAAGLVVIVLDAMRTLGSFEAFLTAVVLAGVLQWILGRLRAGDLGACFPAAVIKGMLAAIGIVLIVKQLPLVLGFASTEHALQHVPDDAQILDAWTAALGAVTESALVVTLVALAILFAWESPRVRRLPVLGRLPGPLLAVLWGAGYQMLATAADSPAALAEHQRVVLPALSGWGDFFHELAMPDWSALTDPRIYPIALSLAVVASLETLLCLEATDRLDPLKRVTPPNRELQAQGIGNVLAGLLGGLPITAVIVRSSANIQAGARTRLSAMLHGVLLLLSVLVLTDVLSWIPLAALSAILLHTGFKLAKPALFADAWRQGAAGIVPFAITVVAILATDLLAGILIGLASGMLFVIRAGTRDAFSMTTHQGAHLLRLRKEPSFFSKPALRACLARVKPGEAIIIDGSHCLIMDNDIRETLEDFVSHARERHIEVELRSLPATAPKALTASAAA